MVGRRATRLALLLVTLAITGATFLRGGAEAGAVALAPPDPTEELAFRCTKQPGMDGWARIESFDLGVDRYEIWVGDKLLIERTLLRSMLGDGFSAWARYHTVDEEYRVDAITGDTVVASATCTDAPPLDLDSVSCQVARVEDGLVVSWPMIGASAYGFFEDTPFMRTIIRFEAAAADPAGDGIGQWQVADPGAGEWSVILRAVDADGEAETRCVLEDPVAATCALRLTADGAPEITFDRDGTSLTVERDGLVAARRDGRRFFEEPTVIDATVAPGTYAYSIVQSTDFEPTALTP